MIRRIAFAAAALAVSLANAQVTDNAVVIEAGNLSITKADFEQMLSGDPRLATAKTRPSAKLALGNDFGRAFALEAEARRRHLEELPSIQLKIRNYTQQLLANELVISLRKGYLKDDAALNAQYSKNIESYAQPRVRQILVRTAGSQVALRKGKPDLSVTQARAKAEALLARLNQGADFGKLAQAESDDLGSVNAGGDIGFVPRGATVAPFEAAAYAQPVGMQSKIVQSEYGFHIIRVEERKPLSLDAVKAIVANDLAHKDLDAIILNGFKLNTAYFGAPATTQ